MKTIFDTDKKRNEEVKLIQDENRPNKIKVSVLVPIYNVEKYLRTCLDSLVFQTLEDIEIICINDGSSDSSLDILKEYAQKDSRIKIVDKKNTGYGNSMNIGIELAQGEFIGIVESDDFVHEKMFEDLYNLAIRNKAEIVKSDYFYYSTLKNQARKAGKISKRISNRVINVRKYLKILKRQPSIWSAIYSNEFLKEKNIRFLETPGASFQDTSFYFKTMALAERIVLTDKAYLYYRQDNEKSSVHSKDKIFNICTEFEEITRFLDSNPDIKKSLNTYKLIKQYTSYMWNLKRIDAKFRDEFLEKFSSTFKFYYDSGEIDFWFYLKINKYEFDLLLKDRERFKKLVERILRHDEEKLERRSLFSVRINSSRISIVLFGKQIIEIG